MPPPVPHEVVLLILDHLERSLESNDACHEECSRLSLVCKRWTKPAQAIGRRNVTLRNAVDDPLLRHLLKHRHLLRHVHCLQIIVRNGPDEAALSSVSTPLAECFRGCTRLRGGTPRDGFNFLSYIRRDTLVFLELGNYTAERGVLRCIGEFCNLKDLLIFAPSARLVRHKLQDLLAAVARLEHLEMLLVMPGSLTPSGPAGELHEAGPVHEQIRARLPLAQVFAALPRTVTARLGGVYFEPSEVEAYPLVPQARAQGPERPRLRVLVRGPGALEGPRPARRHAELYWSVREDGGASAWCRCEYEDFQRRAPPRA
ncbi:hypothetical protein JCM10449v2_006234 [Rhodotorula kratochvilovae]